jgi:hypothetical protein
MTTYYMLGCLFAGTLTGSRVLEYYKKSQRVALTLFFFGFLSCKLLNPFIRI